MNILKQKKIEEKKDEIEKLKSKFKEIKTLVYSYKSDKDNETNNLQKELESFKELDDLNNGYERIIYDASNQIEEFMVKNKFSYKNKNNFEKILRKKLIYKERNIT